MAESINIMVLRHSAFYSPLLYTICGGFLEAEGLKPGYTIAESPQAIATALNSGNAHLSQLAVAASFAELERGETPSVVHFAQINQRDGFFIAGPSKQQPFSWTDLIGKRVLVDHLFQPLAMFNYALHKQGINPADIHVINAGDVHAMDAAFRRGEADYIHQQGPAPQQLAFEGKASVLAAIGDVIGDVAFSSLCATRSWLETEQAKAFMRAYRKACAALITRSAAKIANAEAGFFPDIEPDVLTHTIATYQQLGCWSADPCISQPSYQTLLDVFLHSGTITRAHDYHSAIVLPPE